MLYACNHVVIYLYRYAYICKYISVIFGADNASVFTSKFFELRLESLRGNRRVNFLEEVGPGFQPDVVEKDLSRETLVSVDLHGVNQQLLSGHVVAHVEQHAREDVIGRVQLADDVLYSILVVLDVVVVELRRIESRQP